MGEEPFYKSVSEETYGSRLPSQIGPPSAWCAENTLQNFHSKLGAYSGKDRLLYKIDVLNGAFRRLDASSGMVRDDAVLSQITDLLSEVHAELEQDYATPGEPRHDPILWQLDDFDVNRLLLFLEQTSPYMHHPDISGGNGLRWGLGVVRIFNACIEHSRLSSRRYQKLVMEVDFHRLLENFLLLDQAAWTQDSGGSHLGGVDANDHFDLIFFLLCQWSLAISPEVVDETLLDRIRMSRPLLETLFRYAEGKPALFYAALRRVGNGGTVFLPSVMASALLMKASSNEEYGGILDHMSERGNLPSSTFPFREEVLYLVTELLGRSTVQLTRIAERRQAAIQGYLSIRDQYDPSALAADRAVLLRDLRVLGEEIYEPQDELDLSEPHFAVGDTAWCSRRVEDARDVDAVVNDPDRNPKEKIFGLVDALNCLHHPFSATPAFPAGAGGSPGGGVPTGDDAYRDELVKLLYPVVVDLLNQFYSSGAGPADAGHLDFGSLSRSWLEVEFQKFLQFVSHWADIEAESADAFYNNLKETKESGGEVDQLIQQRIDAYYASFFLIVRMVGQFFRIYPPRAEEIHPIPETGIISDPSGGILFGGPSRTPPPPGSAGGPGSSAEPIGPNVPASFHLTSVLDPLFCLANKILRTLDLTAGTCLDRSPTTWSEADHSDFLLFLAFEANHRFEEIPLTWDNLVREDPSVDPHEVVRKHFVIASLFRWGTCMNVLRFLANRYEHCQTGVRTMLLPMAYLVPWEQSDMFAQMVNERGIPGTRMRGDETLEIFAHVVLSKSYSWSRSTEFLRDRGMSVSSFDWNSPPAGMEADPAAQAKAFISILSYFTPAEADPVASGSLYCVSKDDLDRAAEQVVAGGGLFPRPGMIRRPDLEYLCCSPRSMRFRQEIASELVGERVLHDISQMGLGLSHANGRYDDVIVTDFESYITNDELGGAAILIDVVASCGSQSPILGAMEKSVRDSELEPVITDGFLQHFEAIRSCADEAEAEDEEMVEDDAEGLNDLAAEMEQIIERWDEEDASRGPEECCGLVPGPRLFDPEFIEAMQEIARDGESGIHGLNEIREGMTPDEWSAYSSAHPWLFPDMNFTDYAGKEMLDDLRDFPIDLPESEAGNEDLPAAGANGGANSGPGSASFETVEQAGSQQRLSPFMATVTQALTDLEDGRLRNAENTGGSLVSKEGGETNQFLTLMGYQLQAMAALKANRQEAARRYVDSALEIGRKDSRSTALLAIAVARQGQPDKALDLADRAISLNKESAFAHIAKAVVLRVASRYSQAHEEFRAARELAAAGRSGD